MSAGDWVGLLMNLVVIAFYGTIAVLEREALFGVGT